jgi:hypothetical protein
MLPRHQSNKEILMSIEIDTQEIVDRVQNAFGVPRRGPVDAGFYNGDRDLYRFIAVVKGSLSGSMDVFYDGYEEWDEAAEYAQETAYGSITDPEGEGIWLVVAIVDTTTDEVYYPDVVIRTPEKANGRLTDWGF